jgi:hypothetical protein
LISYGCVALIPWRHKRVTPLDEFFQRKERANLGKARFRINPSNPKRKLCAAKNFCAQIARA